MARKTVWWIIAILAGVIILTQRIIAGDIKAALSNKNVQAFLAVIRTFESAGYYDVVYGGQHFTDFSNHPHIRVPFTDPRNGQQNFSTAAGAYQITYPTWVTIQAVAFLPDFSPASQDEAAIWLLKLRGALPYVIEGDFDNAIRVASGTWASLPFSTSKQHKVSLALAQQVYRDNEGKIA